MESEEVKPEKTMYSEKLRRAAHLLLFRRGKMPGAKDWELKQRLGRNYEEILNQLNQQLSFLDLEIKKIQERSELGENLDEKPRPPEFRYVVTSKGTIAGKDVRLLGWRVDNLAALTATIAYLLSKQGKALRNEVEKLLAEKFGRWRSLTLLDVFLRTGYLVEDPSGLMSLGWRAEAEVDLRNLMTLLAETRT